MRDFEFEFRQFVLHCSPLLSSVLVFDLLPLELPVNSNLLSSANCAAHVLYLALILASLDSTIGWSIVSNSICNVNFEFDAF